MNNVDQTVIYVSDLDGTLLQRDASLSAHARDSIIRLLNEEVKFTVATARSMTSTKEILGDLPFALPVICSNGGSIYDYRSHRALQVELIPQHIIREVILDIKESKDTAFVSVNVDGKEKVYFDGIPNAGMKWYQDDRLEAQDDRLTFIDDIRELVSYPITTITFMNNFFHIDKNKNYFNRNYNGQLLFNFFENKYSPGWHWLSLHSTRATKAKAIDTLRELTGLEDSRIVVFGDELNDIPMFKRADKAVAMQNALPSVIENADETIGSNESDAVINYILEANNMA